MSVDKLVDSTQLDSDLTSVANAIRTKGGTSASLAFPAGFVQAIGNIPTGGGGITITSKTVQIKNGRSSSTSVIRVTFNTSSEKLGIIGGNISAGSTTTINNAAVITDNNGEYFEFHVSYNIGSTFQVTYNETPCTVVTIGSSSQWDICVYLPAGFDNSYPFVFNS